MSYLHESEYLLFNFRRCTVHSGNAERLRLDNLVSFMLHKLVFLGCHLQFASYPSYPRSHRILTVVKFYRYGCRPMRYLSSMGAPLTKIVINASQR